MSVASAYITSYIPAPKIPSINYLSQKHLGHINPLPSDYVVDILFGQDCPDVVKVLETKDGGPGKPYASRSALGWSVCGPIPRNMICHSVTLDQAVEKMWSLDNELSDERLHSYDDRMVIEYWDKTVTMENGHYVIPIPWKRIQDGVRKPLAENNKVLALNRYASLRKRLVKDPELKAKYASGIQDMIGKGYAEEIPPEELHRDDEQVHYLPHHPVINPNKEKIRIVFDCSISLNQHVLRNPDLTNPLTAVLLRFREHKIALVEDREAMYHQCMIPKRERDMLRFLWPKDGDLNS